MATRDMTQDIVEVSMRTFIKFIRAIKYRFTSISRRLKKLSAGRKKVRWQAKYGQSNIEDPYVFSKSDVRLYLEELSTVMLPIKREQEVDGYFLLRIGDQRLWWPRDLSYADLPFLYHEVFDAWKRNPSSYDHPRVDIPSVDWIIDAGASEGFFSLFALTRSPATLIAVEPSPVLAEALRKTLGDESLRTGRDFARVHVVEAALGASEGVAVFSFDPEHVSEGTTSAVTSKPLRDRVKVTQETIDRVVDRFQFDGNGIIKMDIEGAEMLALAGARRTLRELMPNLAVAVYHGYGNARECARIITDANPSYRIEHRGMYGYFDPPRPYLLFAY